MATDQQSIVFSDISFSDEEEQDLSNDFIEIAKKKIEQHYVLNRLSNQAIEIDSAPFSASEQEPQHISFLYEESQDSNYEEQYLPQVEHSEVQSVRSQKRHQLRSQDLSIITKDQFKKNDLSHSPIFPQQPSSIVIEDEVPQPSPFQNFKMEHVKVNFKEEMRGAVTKKTKIQFLMKHQSFMKKRTRSVKIQKKLKKLAKELG